MKSLWPTVRAAKGIASASFSSFVLRFRLTFFSITSPVSPTSASSSLTAFVLLCRFFGVGFCPASAAASVGCCSSTLTFLARFAVGGDWVMLAVSTSSMTSTFAFLALGLAAVFRIFAGCCSSCCSSANATAPAARSSGASDRSESSSLGSLTSFLFAMVQRRGSSIR